MLTQLAFHISPFNSGHLCEQLGVVNLLLNAEMNSVVRKHWIDMCYFLLNI